MTNKLDAHLSLALDSAEDAEARYHIRSAMQLAMLEEVDDE